MASKKNKHKSGPKHAQQLSPPEMMKRAEEHLQQGQIEQALQLLRRAENELKPRVTVAGKKISTPPHLIAAQAALPGLMTRALSAHALTLSDPAQKLAALEEVVKRAPAEARYLVALGACRLAQGNAEAAFANFQKADELSPEDKLTTRAFALGLLANGRSREADELLKRIPAESRDESQRRLAALSAWLADDQAPPQSLLRGLRHLAKGETEAAREALGELPALDHNPTLAEAMLIATQFFYSGAANFEAQRFREAMADWREAQRMAAAHKLALPWREQLAAYYHRIAERAVAEDLSLSIECWQAALEMVPADKVAANNITVTRRAQAQQAWHAGQIEQAAQIWQELLQLKPQDETLLQNAAIASERLGRKAEAVKHWRALARLWRQQFKQRADEASFKQRWQSLEQRLLVLMIEASQSPEQILEEMEATLKFDPENHDLRLKVAELLMEDGQPQKALKQLEQIERQRGASAILLTHKAQALEMAYRSKDARKAFQQALALEPQNKLVQTAYLGFLDQEAEEADDEDDLDLALELSQEQLRVDPNYFPALGRVASIYFDDDRDEEAKELLTRAVEANPQKPQPHIATGAVYLQNNLKKEAKAAFARAIELEPSAECFFQIGVAYAENGEHKDALKQFDRAADTASLEMLLEIAMTLTMEGKKKDADRYLNKAKKLDPNHPLPYFIKAMSIIGGGGPLGLMLMKDKDRQAALKEFAEVDRLMAGRKEYEAIREEIGQLKQALEQGPPGLGDLLGGGGKLPPFLLGDEDDDDDDFFFGGDDDDDDEFSDLPPLFSPPRKRATKKKKKRK